VPKENTRNGTYMYMYIHQVYMHTDRCRSECSICFSTGSKKSNCTFKYL